VLAELMSVDLVWGV